MKFDSGFTMYGTGPAKPMVAITKPFDKQAATAGNGTMVAAAVDSRAKVDEMHAKALSLGGQEFYGAYFRDLDGNKLCAFKIGPK